MNLIFYLSAFIAILATIRVITNTNPIHALLYFIISLIAVAIVFFSLGASFAAVLEVIAYAGAVMVLFVFVLMMLNQGPTSVMQERRWINPKIWIGPGILSAALLFEIIYVLLSSSSTSAFIGIETIDAKRVGISLFGPYVLVVELASMLLISGAIIAFHLGRNETEDL